MSLQENHSEKNPIEETGIQVAREILGREITGWETLKKGMTNRSFLFSADVDRFIIRIPGEGTDRLINRKQEAEVYKTISGLGFCDDPVFMNPETGVKITAYLEDVRVCNPHNEADLKMCMSLLKRLHGMKLVVDHGFDLFGQIAFYEKLRGCKESIYTDYEETKEKVFSLRDYIDKQEKKSCLCHIDAVPDNFLICGDRVQLTDWEYAGMQDPHADIAMFCVYCDYTRADVDRLIDLYFHGDCDQPTRVKIYCYISACGLLWSNWCEYKHHLGVEFGEYAMRQYRYARDYYEIAMRELKRL